MENRRAVLITGCSEGGTGNALAKEYHEHGFHVFATARRPEAMQNLKSLANVTLIPLDVTSIASVTSAFATVTSVLDRESMLLAILVNNAGISSNLPVVDTPLQTSHKIIETNLLGPITMVHTFMPLLMKASSRSTGTVCIINTGSVTGLMPGGGGSYSASKAALHMWSDTLRLELWPFNIHVVHLVMGAIDTSIWDSVKESLPPGSLYSSIEQSLIGFRMGFRTYAISAPAFARRVVGATSRGSPPKVLCIGSGATIGWIASRLVPQWLNDLATSYLLGLWRLRAIVRRK